MRQGPGLNRLLLVTALFAVSLALGLRASPEASSQAMEEVSRFLEPLRGLGVGATLVFVILNNGLKTLGAMVLGVLAGIPPLVFVALNGYVLGLLVVALVPDVGYAVVVASLAPHGILEVPALLWASALGLGVGQGALRRLLGHGSPLLPTLRHALRIYVVYVLPTLVIAAFIEVFITPLVLDAVRTSAG